MERRLIELIREALSNPAVIASYRTSSSDWTRRRVLSFPLTVVLILQGKKHSLQTTLNRVFSAIGAVFSVPTASAMSQARRKLKPEIFLHLTQLITDEFYGLPVFDIALDVPESGLEPWEERDVEEEDEATSADDSADEYDLDLAGAQTQLKWRGHRVLSVDGTNWALPDTEENRLAFGVATNQVESEPRAQGQGSVLYDVLNDIGLNLVLKSTRGEAQMLREDHLEHLKTGDLVVLDRGYVGYATMVALGQRRCDFVIRQKLGGFKAVEEFVRSSQRETVLEVTVNRARKALIEKNNWPASVRIRLIKIRLPNGGDRDADADSSNSPQGPELDGKGRPKPTEMVLATSLIDPVIYPASEIGRLYTWRWRIENYIDRLKNIFEVERFSSPHPQNLLQDLYGVLFLSTLESLLTRRAAEELAIRSQEREIKPLRVNRAGSYTALLDRTVFLLIKGRRSLDRVLEELQHLFKTKPISIRPHRKFPRIRSTPSCKLRHQRFKKRLT